VPRPPASVVRFYSRSAVQAVRTAAYGRLGRDQTYRVGKFDVTLPAGHRLPWFQRLFPDYDRYAAGLLSDLCKNSTSPLLIDVGANVGDTSLLALDAVHALSVVAVEGDPRFVSYLRKNTEQVADRVEIVDKFVAVESLEGFSYHGGQSTGGFVATDTAQPVTSLVSVPELLRLAEGHDLVIWKSDTDGLDMTILDAEWSAVASTCDVIWFELDPFLDTENGVRLPHLAAQIEASDRVVIVFDNVGRRMLTVPAAGVADVLAGLSRWLGEPSIPGETSYFDVWAISPRLAHRSDQHPTGWSLGPS